MHQKFRFAVMGGDLRQQYFLQFLRGRGHETAVWEHSGILADGSPQMDIEALLHWAEIICLPLPATKDGVFLFTPGSRESVDLHWLAKQVQGKRIIGGRLAMLQEIDPLWKEADCWDYAEDPQFAVCNAAATAESALALAVQQSPGMLCGSSCLVTGWGRIAKLLAADLQQLGAKVTVAARRPDALADAKVRGMHPIALDCLIRSKGRYDYLFNTIPAQVLPAAVLEQVVPDGIAMELASPPFGFDHVLAQQMGLNVVFAGGLPGRFSPKAAGEIIGETVLAHLEE